MQLLWVEFGYEDINYVSVKSYRDKWLHNGSQWFNRGFKPRNWNLSYQLLHIPDGFKQLMVTGCSSLPFTYDTLGRKLKKVSGGVRTDYIGGIQYNGGPICTPVE